VAGDRAAHANRFYEILQGLPDMKYYLLNTGAVGILRPSSGDLDEPPESRYHDIKLQDTMAILDSLLRGGLEDWADSPTGFEVPGSVRAVDDIYFLRRSCSRRLSSSRANTRSTRCAARPAEAGRRPHGTSDTRSTTTCSTNELPAMAGSF
jgi:hypothetical protein